jgi:hypothetical protein
MVEGLKVGLATIYGRSWPGVPGLRIPARGEVRRSPYTLRSKGRTIERSAACPSTPTPVKVYPSNSLGMAIFPRSPRDPKMEETLTKRMEIVGRGDLVTVSDIGIFARIQNFWNLLPAAGRFTLTIYLLYYIYYYLK